MTRLNPRLAAALRVIEVSQDCRAAMVGQREVTAADPRSFRPQLAAAIYDELHAGRAALKLPAGRDLRDPALEDRLRALLPHREIARDVLVISPGADDVLVRLDGVKVWVPRTRIRTEDWPADQGTAVEIRIPADRAALSPGFFLADSAQPYPAGEAVLRIYVHLQTVAAALDVWGSVLGLLAGLGLGYRAKVASWPEMLPRRDGLVVYVAARDREVSRRIAAVIRGIRGVGSQGSVFAEPVAPGVAIGWEPDHGRTAARALSFGEHRAAALADGLVRHAVRRADGDDIPVAASVRQALIEAGIDPANPACNRPAGGRREGGRRQLGSGPASADGRCLDHRAAQPACASRGLRLREWRRVWLARVD
jgi:hypothetical protein